MSTKHCEECGALLLDSPRGYLTGCEHYPPAVKKLNREERRNVAIERAYDHKHLYPEMPETD